MNFLRENKDLLRLSNAMKTSRGECNDFCKEIKALNPKMESLHLTVGGSSGESNIANLLERSFQWNC